MRPSQIRPSRIRPNRLQRPVLAAILALGFATPSEAHERPSTAPAARFLQAAIDAALPLAMPPISAAADTRLQVIMDSALDLPDLTTFALGRYRGDLNSEATTRAQEAIGDQLRALAYRAGEAYPDLAITITGLRIDAEGNRRIQSVALLPSIGPVEVDWILKPQGSSYQISDVQAFGLTLRHFLRDWVTMLVAGRNPSAVFGPPGAASPQ